MATDRVGLKDEEHPRNFWSSRKIIQLTEERRLKNWIQLLIFYSAFYFVLILLSAFMFLIFYQMIDQRSPSLRNGESALGKTPGLSLRPRPSPNNIRSTLISFKSTNQNTYKHYVNDLQSFLDTYVDVKHGSDIAGIHSCIGRLSAPEGQYCPFDLNAEIRQTSVCFNASRQFGYEDGKPCILLKLNNIFDWIAEPYLLDDEFPMELKMHLQYTNNQAHKFREPLIFFTCEGENHADIENIGQIEYIPKPGVAPYYFPFQNPDGYRSPFVFLRFTNPAAGTLINVECKAWARNIKHSKGTQIGRVHFELLVN